MLKAYHLVYEGQGGEYSMLPWVSESWLKGHRCAGEKFGNVPIPFVRTPADYEPPMFDLATYGEIRASIAVAPCISMYAGLGGCLFSTDEVLTNLPYSCKLLFRWLPSRRQGVWKPKRNDSPWASE